MIVIGIGKSHRPKIFAAMINFYPVFRLSLREAVIATRNLATIIENLFNASSSLAVEGYEASEKQSGIGRDYGMEQCCADG